MALTSCYGCGKEISISATACPNCGAPKRKQSTAIPLLVTGAFGLVLFFAVFSYATRPTQLTPEQQARIPKSPELTAEERAKEVKFQVVLAGARQLKAAAKNPDSFKLETARMMPTGVVCYEYRATNSFNAVVLERMTVTDKCGSREPALWKKHCSDEQGIDFSSIRSVL